MSGVLLSWRQPKESGPLRPNSRRDRLWDAAVTILCFVGLVQTIRELIHGDGFGPAWAVPLFWLWWLNIRYGIVRPTYSLTEDGLRVRFDPVEIRGFYRWPEIEWYEIWPASLSGELSGSDNIGALYVKTRKGKQLKWLLLRFDRSKMDENLLTRILQSKLPGRCLDRWQ